MLHVTSVKRQKIRCRKDIGHVGLAGTRIFLVEKQDTHGGDMKITSKQLKKIILEAVRDIAYYDKDIESFEPSTLSKKELIDLYGQRSGRLAIGSTQERFHKAFQLLDLPVDIIFLPRRILMSSLMYPLITGDPGQGLANNTSSMLWTRFASALASLATKAKLSEIGKIADSIKQDGLTIVFQTLEGQQSDESFADISIPWILHDIGHGVMDSMAFDRSIFGGTGVRGRVAPTIGLQGIRQDFSMYVRDKYPTINEFFKTNNFTKTVMPHDTHASLFAWYLMHGEIPAEVDDPEDREMCKTIFNRVKTSLKGRVYITDLMRYKK